jgi:hypothetical protein
MLLAALLAATLLLEQRYILVGDPEFFVVSKVVYDNYVKDKACYKIEDKKYPQFHVENHLCYM